MWDWPHLHQVESQSHRSGDGQHCIRDKCLFPDQLATGCWLSLGEICCTKDLLIIALTDSVILWSLVVCIEDLYWYRYWFLRRFLHFAYLVILSNSTLSEFTSKRSIHSRRWPKSFWTRMSKDIQHLKEKKTTTVKSNMWNFPLWRNLVNKWTAESSCCSFFCVFWL